MFKVIVKKTNIGYNAVKDILSELELNINELKTKKILIKPNAGRYVSAKLGINTNPDIIAGIIDFLFENDINNISIGESPILGVKALANLKKCGITEIANKRNVPLIDLDANGFNTISIPNSKIIDKLKVCKDMLKFDYIISVPVMKTHMHTQVSLGLKNMKGCLFNKEKVKLHQLPNSDYISPPAKPLDLGIADMSKILLPDLTIIDGTIGQEGLGPSGGDPIESNLVIGSKNCLAADWTAVKLMGMNPDKIYHLQLSINELAELDKNYKDFNNKITVSPKDYIKYAVSFKLPPEKISFEYKNVVVDDNDSCSACLSTVIMFLKRYYKQYADYFDPENPLKLAFGKGVEKKDDNTILIGNCTLQKNKGKTFVNGCPPVASDIKKMVDALLK